jgi:hypothetical protein
MNSRGHHHNQPTLNPTYINPNNSSFTSHIGLMAVAESGHLSQSSMGSSIAFPSASHPGINARHQARAYVTQTLEELMQKPKKPKKANTGPYGRQQIAINNHNDLMKFNHVPTTSSGSGQSNVGRSNRRKVTDRLLKSENDYTVFIPKKSLTSNQFNSTIECKGCNKKFQSTILAAGVMFGEPAYFVHCVKECPSYRAMDLIRKCDECALFFMNSQSERKHHGEVHHKNLKIEKPDWMSDQVYRTRSGIRCNTKVSCSACGKYFGAQNSNGKVSYSLEYMIHCIEDCVEYDRLGLIQTCPVCCCKFLNKLSLSQHKIKSKH